jgi:hypothetical protein
MRQVITLLLVSWVLLAPRFEPIQPELFSTGANFMNAWADIDGDEDLDLFVGFNGTPNRMYRNNAGTFIDIAAAVGLADARATRAGSFGDFDGDGDPDLLVGFAPGNASVLKLYRNDRGRFIDVSDNLVFSSNTVAVRQPSWIDFDGDGDLDLFVAFRDRTNALFRNDRGRFTDVGTEVGIADARKTVGAVWFDYDEDGDLDLYAGNMDGDANGLFRNDGGRFKDVAAEAGVEWGGRIPKAIANGTVRPCAADVNNDGHVDLFMANYGKNGLFLNRGGGRFDDVSAAWGIDIDSRYDSCAFADFDNDGRLDLYVNGTVTGGTSYRDYLFQNTGMRFEDVTPENVKGFEADHGVQWADIDADGDLDLALTGSQAKGMHHILRNMLAVRDANRSLQVRVAKPGAEVRLFAAGTRRLLAMRLVDTGSGYDSQNDGPVHFGLSETTRRVDIEVTFPQAGKRVVTTRNNVNPSDWLHKRIDVR